MFQLIEGATGRWSRKMGEVYEESAGFVLICQQCHGCCYTVQLGALQLYLEWDLQHRIEFPAQEVVNDIGVCLKQSPEDVMLHFWRDLGETDRQTCLLMAPHCYFLPITCLRLWYLNLPPSPSSSFLLGAPIFFSLFHWDFWERNSTEVPLQLLASCFLSQRSSVRYCAGRKWQKMGPVCGMPLSSVFMRPVTIHPKLIFTCAMRNLHFCKSPRVTCCEVGLWIYLCLYNQ